MSGCAYCVTQPPPMSPMKPTQQTSELMGTNTAVNRSALPFGFGVLVGPDGVPINPVGSGVPSAFVNPEDKQFAPIIGPRGPRMFLVTFADPSSVVMEPLHPEVEEAHVAKVGELYKSGRLHFVGHQSNGKEGYMLLSAPSLQDAWTIAQSDPLIASGYFRSIDVKEIEGPYPWNRYRSREYKEE